MSNENIKRFMEEVKSDTTLAQKIDALQSEYKEKLVVLAKEAGFQITLEDLAEEIEPVCDNDMKSVSGGWSPSPWGSYCTTHGCK